MFSNIAFYILIPNFHFPIILIFMFDSLPQIKGHSDSSIHAQSTGEESNSSDTGLSERGLAPDREGRDRGMPLSGNGPHSMADLITPKTEPSDYSQDHHSNSLMMDPSRTPNFSAALLGLQGSCTRQMIFQCSYLFIIFFFWFMIFSLPSQPLLWHIGLLYQIWKKVFI